jgi:hypothetical protein
MPITIGDGSWHNGGHLMAAEKVSLFRAPTACLAKPLTAQQQKMKDCNVAANEMDLKGDVRKSFMSSCLTGS